MDSPVFEAVATKYSQLVTQNTSTHFR